MVVAALQSPIFLEAIQERLGEKQDQDAVQSRIDALETTKRQLTGAKAKLAAQMDNLDITDPHYDSKYADMQTRLDTFYDRIAEVDANIEHEKTNISKVYQIRATMENAVRIMEFMQDTFSKLAEATKKEIYQGLLESVELFVTPLPDGRQVKAVHFKFPILVEGETDTDWYADDVPEGWDTGNHGKAVHGTENPLIIDPSLKLPGDLWGGGALKYHNVGIVAQPSQGVYPV